MLGKGAELVGMDEAAYDSEALLQELLAKYPDLLAGDQMNADAPRRWILVTREMAVSGEDPGSPRWSLDHLFLDQDAVPTLVEVKRGSNTDIRRKVVGQMLDYAANAVVHWPVEKIQAEFLSCCEREGEDADETLAALLDDEAEPGDFWKDVETNLQAGRIRMVFVADSVPTELRRVVEFLNEQMTPAEVLAIEVKQFVGAAMKTLVPRVVGQTEAARRKKHPPSPPGRRWDEQSFMARVREVQGDAVRRAAQEFLDWVRPRVTHVSWGTGSTYGGFVPVVQHGKTKVQICRVGTHGPFGFGFHFDRLRKKPPFDDEVLRRELLSRINEIPGVHFDEDILDRRARLPLETLTDREAMAAAKAVVSWIIEQTTRASRPVEAR